MKSHTSEGSKHLEKLKAAGVIGITRACRIFATEATASDKGDDHQIIVHLQRHGQGFHNLVSDCLKNVSNSPPEDERTDLHPYRLPEMVDPPLTDKGREQCKSSRAKAAALKPEVVLVSPLCRAIQTAAITFCHLVSSDVACLKSHARATVQV